MDTRRWAASALAGSAALTFGLSGPANADEAPRASAWAAFSTAPAWLDPSATVQFYVASPALAQSAVGTELRLQATAPGLDCSTVALGQSGPAGWGTPGALQASCASGTATRVLTVTPEMVGSSVSLHGWAASSSSSQVVLDGTVEVAGQSSTVSSTATAPSAAPSTEPTATPSSTEPAPSAAPSSVATVTPSAVPSEGDTASPAPTSQQPTAAPSQTASATPTANPTASATPSTTAPATPSEPATVTPSAAPSETAAPGPTATPTATATPTTAPTAQQPGGATIDEQFDAWPAGSSTNASGTLRINGDWPGSGGNQLLRSNVEVADGVMTLISRGNQKSGSEIQSTPDKLVGKGYYEASMQMSSTPGILSNLFFIGKDYQFPEIDMEVRSRDSGPGNRHSIFYSVHYAGGGHQYKEVFLPFDPADGFHSYGFLMGTDSISFYADGKLTHTWQDLPTNLGLGATEPQGYLMSNSWAQDSDWVGPLPTQDTRTRINWIRYWGGATTPQFTPAG